MQVVLSSHAMPCCPVYGGQLSAKTSPGGSLERQDLGTSMDLSGIQICVLADSQETGQACHNVRRAAPESFHNLCSLTFQTMITTVFSHCLWRPVFCCVTDLQLIILLCQCIILPQAFMHILIGWSQYLNPEE